MPALYLLPVLLGDVAPTRVLPDYNIGVMSPLRYFIVEDLRSARRFLRRVHPDFPIDDCTFFELNRHTSPEVIATFLAPLREGHSMGLLSEAGCPAIADPGAAVVALAHREGLTVVPLVGPSSILLSLMASGFNGQNFAFLGYLPVKSAERVRALHRLEQRIMADDQTQIFIETPYRNNALIAEMLASLRPTLHLCIGADLTTPQEEIRTLTLAGWKRTAHDFDRRPCIFLLYK